MTDFSGWDLERLGPDTPDPLYQQQALINASAVLAKVKGKSGPRLHVAKEHQDRLYHLWRVYHFSKVEPSRFTVERFLHKLGHESAPDPTRLLTMMCETIDCCKPDGVRLPELQASESGWDLSRIDREIKQAKDSPAYLYQRTAIVNCLDVVLQASGKPRPRVLVDAAKQDDVYHLRELCRDWYADPANMLKRFHKVVGDCLHDTTEMTVAPWHVIPDTTEKA